MTSPRKDLLKLALVGVVTLALTLMFAYAPGPGTRAQSAPPCPGASLNQINSTMYFQSKPQDAAQCGMSVRNGQVVFNGNISNPSMSCPDMASWKLFAEIVSQQFWRNWAADEETWPANPLPLCGAPGSDPKNCCNPNSRNNPGYDNKLYRAQFCPYFPGDHPQNPPESFGQPPSKAHTVNLGRGAAEPGRDIRQSMAEIVFRNKPLFDYVFRNNVYNQDGIKAVFNRNSGNIGGDNSGLPYRVANGGGDGKTPLVEFDFPVESVMVKSNWVNAEFAQKQLGLRDDPQNPYVKMSINSADTDNNGLVEGPGVYWLVAFHVSSKETPNWLWSTFEHVNNPGRCDYIGCNDSYGYRSPDAVPTGLATNYTAPKTRCDNLPIASYVFDTGKTYGGGTISTSLQRVLQGMGIGTKASASPSMPSPSDRAWLSYRLKGTQTEFTDSTGNISRLGNSVTEGGFVNSSSCIACHARAGTTAGGTIPPALGVFVNEVSGVGYGQSYNGTPNPAWYFQSNQPPALSVLQTDFIWGFLCANSLNNPGTPNCGTVPSSAPPAAAAAPAPAPAAAGTPAPGSARTRARTPRRN